MDDAEGEIRYQDPENQLVPLRKWVAEKGWTVCEEFVDKGSGANPNRPRFLEMTAQAHQRKFKAVCVWKLDRFSREPMSIVLARVQRFRQLGVGLVSYTESWMDTTKDSPIADLVIAFMSWAAAEERRKISERTKGGIARRRAIGQWKGGRPNRCVTCRGNLQERGPPKKWCRCTPVKGGGVAAVEQKIVVPVPVNAPFVRL